MTLQHWRHSKYMHAKCLNCLCVTNYFPALINVAYQIFIQVHFGVSNPGIQFLFMAVRTNLICYSNCVKIYFDMKLRFSVFSSPDVKKNQRNSYLFLSKKKYKQNLLIFFVSCALTSLQTDNKIYLIYTIFASHFKTQFLLSCLYALFLNLSLCFV